MTTEWQECKGASMDETRSIGGFPRIVRDPTDGQTKGIIQIAKGQQPKPCYMCRSFEQDNTKLIQHFLARGLQPDENGCFEQPIPDIKDRKSLKIHPDDYGYCRRDCIVVGMDATCENWKLTQSRSELAGKIRK